MTGLVATAEVLIAAPVDRVWMALTEPAEVKQWMFGTDLETDWTPGSPITWSGTFQGKDYQDRGEVLSVDEPNGLSVTHYSPLSGQPDEPNGLSVTHYSPLSGQPDEPESYHTLVYRLSAEGAGTRLGLEQDNNADETAAEHSRANWEQALQALKAHVEGA